MRKPLSALMKDVKKNSLIKFDEKIQQRQQIVTTHQNQEEKAQTIKNKSNLFERQKEELIEQVRRDIDFMCSNPSEQVMKTRLMNMVHKNEIKLYQVDIQKAIQSVLVDLYRYGILEELMSDPYVTDIQVYGDFGIRYFRKGRRYWYKDRLENRIKFKSIEELEKFVEKKMGKDFQFDLSAPSINAIFPDGSRINYKQGPVGVSYWEEIVPNVEEYRLHRTPILTIRRFGRGFSLDELASFGMLTKTMRAYIQFIVELGERFLVGGKTGTGKSTLMNAMLEYTPEEHVTAICEDQPEMQPRGPFYVRMWSREETGEGVGKITIDQNIFDSKRMFFDSLIIGELRDGDTAFNAAEASIMGGFLFGASIHAETPEMIRRQYVNMMLGASKRPSLNYAMELFASAFNQLIACKLVRGQRMVTEISEVADMNDSRVILRPVFERKYSTKTCYFHGLSERIIEKSYEVGIEIPEILKEKREEPFELPDHEED